MMEYFKRTSVNRQTKKIVSYLLMTAIGLVLITPLLWMVFTSLKPMEEIVRYPPTFFPEKIVWQNYLDTITAFPFCFPLLALCKEYFIDHSLSGIWQCSLEFLHCLWVCEIRFSRKKANVCFSPFYDDDSRFCDHDPPICSILKNRLGRNLFTIDRSIIFRQCI